MNSFDIREKFLNFFKKHGHTIVPSSSLIPAQDPTLLFANAGMNQFKDTFLGREKRDYTRATSIQKCVRAGGKHNDLDEVGLTNRHLTFFEMMGNFSFGDYFKKEAIEYAWEFLTKEMGLPAESLVVSVFTTDDEAYNLWNKNIGIPPEKIYRLGEKENFWQMGDTGPCGPCSEIHIDYGKEIGCKTKNCDPSCDCGRFAEIWNLVFMQYDKQKDGILKTLNKTGVDTGMGFERLCMVMQKKESVFGTDIFAPLIKKIEEVAKINYAKSSKEIQAAFHVLCDHVRSSSLLIADGCTPSNDGRGYVLRKIIRRAALFAQKLTDNQKLFTTLANEFICFFTAAYKELKTNKNLILKLLDSEVERFATNLIQGQDIIEKYFEKNLKENKKELSGKQIFKLYDTYGFPTELTKVIATEKGFKLDTKGFESEMQKQKEQSGKKIKDQKEKTQIPDAISTKFVGYKNLEVETKVNFVHQDKNNIWIVTEQSPFYVESGGQVSDQGWIKIKDETHPIIGFYKSDKPENPAIAVKISLKEKPIKIHVEDKVTCIVDYYKRINTQKNHTATHLLQEALVHVCGKHIKQAGSFVDDKYLRFDFNHPQALTKEEVAQVEDIVNNKIQENVKLNIFYTTLKKAQEAGVTAFFGEKYNPSQVRVVQIPDFSAELCGGTHVESTGEIGCFKIENEVALSTGTRRITAVSGPQSIKVFQQSFDLTKTLGKQFKAKPDKILEAIEKQQENLQYALSEIKQLKKQFFKVQIPIWQDSVSPVGKIPFLFLQLDDMDGTTFKQISTEIEKKSPGFYFIISPNSKAPNRINFFGFLSKTWQNAVNLKEFTKLLKEKFEWRGGGSPNMIQGGGNKVDANLEKEIKDWLKIL